VGGFSIIARGFNPADAIEFSLLRALTAVSTSYVALGKAGRASYVEDLDGRLVTFLDDLRWVAVIVRPDFYVYGGAADETELGNLVRALLSDLRNAGVKMLKENQPQSKKVNGEARTI